MIDLGRAGVGLALVAIAGAVAGCGSDGQKMVMNHDAGPDVAMTDISGWFMQTSYETGACDMTQPSTLGSPFIWVEHQMNRYVVHACTGSTEADCTGTYFYDFTQPIENGWHAEGGTALFSQGCTLTVERTDLTVIGNDLRATSFTVQVNKDIMEAQCTVDAALALTSSCTYQVAMNGTRL